MREPGRGREIGVKKIKLRVQVIKIVRPLFRQLKESSSGAKMAGKAALKTRKEQEASGEGAGLRDKRLNLVLRGKLSGDKRFRTIARRPSPGLRKL